MSRHVAVLMGGWSAEREISLVTGAAVADALKEQGFRVTPLDVGRDVAEALLRLKPDLAFNALHGPFGEDGAIQGLLEVMGIPYTHSGVMASAIAMHKPTAKRLFRDAGIPVAEGRTMTRREVMTGALPPKPYVIKPINEGSSVGVRIVLESDNFTPSDDMHWSYGEEVLVERYIPGREIQVAVMGERALGAIEIRPLGRFYDYEAKYTDGKARHLMPAPIEPQAYEEALRLSLLAHRTLGCRGVSRADLRYDDTAGEPGRFCMLEINTQPGMTPLSLVPEIAAHHGIGFAELVRWMVEDASCGR
ncbi:MAG: D-alanine--D-alanine ligase [Alphaproteobacteria bacterium]|nr:D-alanine--D-alanine ligase [Alphaproteobacteria bacterium]